MDGDTSVHDWDGRVLSDDRNGHGFGKLVCPNVKRPKPYGIRAQFSGMGMVIVNHRDRLF
jgi:hypothetical protein